MFKLGVSVFSLVKNETGISTDLPEQTLDWERLSHFIKTLLNTMQKKILKANNIGSKKDSI